jgi:hypothetical protein
MVCGTLLSVNILSKVGNNRSRPNLAILRSKSRECSVDFNSKYKLGSTLDACTFAEVQVAAPYRGRIVQSALATLLFGILIILPMALFDTLFMVAKLYKDQLCVVWCIKAFIETIPTIYCEKIIPISYHHVVF